MNYLRQRFVTSLVLTVVCLVWHCSDLIAQQTEAERQFADKLVDVVMKQAGMEYGGTLAQCAGYNYVASLCSSRPSTKEDLKLRADKMRAYAAVVFEIQMPEAKENIPEFVRKLIEMEVKSYNLNDECLNFYRAQQKREALCKIMHESPDAHYKKLADKYMKALTSDIEKGSGKK